jgi:hypothetical protein
MIAMERPDFAGSKQKMIQKYVSTLRGLYKKYPDSYSLVELSLFFGIYFLNMWVTPFWYWGIYRFNIHVPDMLDRAFLYLWHMSPHLVLPSVILGLFLLALAFFIRKDSLKELGIRFDNIKSSGKECVIVSLITANLFIAIFFIHHEDFTLKSLQYYLLSILGFVLWGTVQQFLLQSNILIRLIQILRNKNNAILVAGAIFSLLHAPNIPLMVLTFIVGLLCCIIFSRHRNIFTLGITHGVMALMVYSLLVPGVIDNFSTGPWRKGTEFVAYLKYEGDTITVKPSYDTTTIPIEIENKSTIIWDSNEKLNAVFITYHLLDAEGNMIIFENRRTSFPNQIAPGESLTVDLVVTIPMDPAHYLIEVDMVREGRWFKDEGLLPIYIPLVVLPYAKTDWDFTG